MLTVQGNHWQALAALLLCVVTAGAQAQDYTRKPWWPSEWGADDRIGALNRMTPDKVLEATQLIRTGTIYDMTFVYEESMPLFSLTPYRRKYTLLIPGAPTYGATGENKLYWNEDYISGHITQDGTQFDALCHMGTEHGKPGDATEQRHYNGLSSATVLDGRGCKQLGIENVTPIFTRGILIDVAGLKGRMLERSEEISVDDLKAALARQGMSEADIRPGDALFYHTGWSRLWKVDNDKFNSGIPGLSPAAGDWVVARKVLLVGTDNWGVEAIPGPDPRLFAPNHQKFLVENGIYIMENLDFSRLIDAKVYEFAFVFGAVPFKGATGSPGRPFAIR
jgi:kynurenine formamidase